MKLLKQNHFLVGLGIGFLAPLPVFGFFYLLNFLLQKTGLWSGLQQEENIYLLSIIGNILLIRIYFINLKLEQTAKGILIMTIAFILLFFYLFF
jgi:hypothetical protein